MQELPNKIQNADVKMVLSIIVKITQVIYKKGENTHYFSSEMNRRRTENICMR